MRIKIKRSLRLFVCGSLIGGIFRLLYLDTNKLDKLSVLALTILNAMLALDENG